MVLVGLAREASDHIRSYATCWDPSSYQFDFTQELVGGVGSSHLTQDRVAAALQRHVKVRAESPIAFVAPQVQQAIVDLWRLQRGDSDARDIGPRQNLCQHRSQIDAGVEIESVVPELSPREDDFTATSALKL